MTLCWSYRFTCLCSVKTHILWLLSPTYFSMFDILFLWNLETLTHLASVLLRNLVQFHSFISKRFFGFLFTLHFSMIQSLSDMCSACMTMNNRRYLFYVRTLGWVCFFLCLRVFDVFDWLTFGSWWEIEFSTRNSYVLFAFCWH